MVSLSKLVKKSQGGMTLWRGIWVSVLVLLFQAGFSLRPPTVGLLREAAAATAAAPSKGKQLLDEWVRRAKQEGEVTVHVQSDWDKGLFQPLTDAFKKRFGLDIKATIVTARMATHLPVAIAETQAGAPATYDALMGDDAETMQLIGAGGTQKIEGWEELLREINPLVRSGKVRPDQINLGPFKDHGFLFMANLKRLVYNTRLISEGDLPRTHSELGNPKYKGKLTQPPWTAHWELAPALLTSDKAEREKWLETVRQAGKNAGIVLPESSGIQRVVLGEVVFSLNQDRYFRRLLAKDPKAPIAFKYFEDYNQVNRVYYTVRTKSRHPAAATLFILWMGTPEAEAIWQPVEMQAVPYGESKIDGEFRSSVEKLGSKAMGFLDSEKSIELLKWYRTEEGRKYLDGMARAIRGE